MRAKSLSSLRLFGIAIFTNIMKKFHVDVGTTSLRILTLSTLVSDIVHHPPLGKSDHDVITFNFNCYLDYSKPKEGYAYHKTDYSAMRQYLELTKWKENYIVLGANQNVEEAWNNLKIKLMELRVVFQ